MGVIPAVQAPESSIPGMLTPTGWTPPPALSYERWAALGHTFAQMDRSVGWWLADWILAGEARYGERFAQAVGETGLAEKTIANRLSVARAFPAFRRRDAVSWSHHQTVASLPAPDQDRLLDLAEKSSLSVTALRREAAGARPRPAPVPVHDTGEPPHLVVGSRVRINAEGLCTISYIGKGATITIQAVRLP